MTKQRNSNKQQAGNGQEGKRRRANNGNGARTMVVDPEAMERIIIDTLQKEDADLFRVSGIPGTEHFHKINYEILLRARADFKALPVSSRKKAESFNTGFIITENWWRQFRSVDGFLGVLVCLGVFTKGGNDTIKDKGEDMGVRTLFFPIFRIITKDGMSEELWCAYVPECFPVTEQGADIYYCPPLNPCPKS